MSSQRKWDGLRWLFVLLGVVFAGMAAWLAFHEGLLQQSAAPLLLIPASFCIGMLLLAVCASDARLQQVAKFFLLIS